MRILYPGGYDLLHEGHIKALQVARHLAADGTLMVGVNSDEFMAHYKRTPRRTAWERVKDVAALGIADQVFVWHGPQGQDQQILARTPDVYVAGTDWLSKDLAHQLNIPSLTWFDDHHISLMYLRRTPGISTTQLLDVKA